MRAYQRVKPGLVIILAAVFAIGLSGCGRRGALQAPPDVKTGASSARAAAGADADAAAKTEVSAVPVGPRDKPAQGGLILPDLRPGVAPRPTPKKVKPAMSAPNSVRDSVFILDSML